MMTETTTATTPKTSKPEPTPRNGVDTKALFATINVVKGQPELAQFTFRASNRWLKAIRCQTINSPTPWDSRAT